MSMMARFVAVTGDQLAAIERRPETVDTIFAIDASRPDDDPAHIRQRLLFRAPRLVNDLLSRLPPDLQRRLRRQLGIGADGRVGTGVNRTLLLQLAEREAARQRVPPQSGAPGHSVSLDKAWHGLHYLLCGAIGPAPGPLGQAVFGGRELGGDKGYGPARGFTPAEVSEISQALSMRGLRGQLKARFDPDRMAEIGVYPGAFEPDDDDWLLDAFSTLRDFYKGAAKAKHAAVTVIE
jgi:hypothetical protein